MCRRHIRQRIASGGSPLPSTSYTDKEGKVQYSDTFHAITKSGREAVNQSVLNAYDLKLTQEQVSEIEVKADEEMEEEIEPEMM